MSYLELETILLSCLWRASFLSVPLLGLIPDKHPCSICFLKLSASFIAAEDSTDHPSYSTFFHFVKNLLSCVIRTIGCGVAFVLSTPLSVGSWNTMENSFIYSCSKGCLFRNFITHSLLHGIHLNVHVKLFYKHFVANFSMHNSCQ